MKSAKMSFYISLFYFSNADKNISSQEKDPVELFTACTKDALVVSEIFCLHADYRKDVPPPSKNILFVCIVMLCCVIKSKKSLAIIFST